MARLRHGEAWGRPGSLPEDGVVVASDAEARALVTAARRSGAPLPVLGLLGGDLCTTLGGRGGQGAEARMRSGPANVVEVDLGVALLDGLPHYFVAHLVARTRLWRGRAYVAMNAAFLGPYNLGPRAHPGDGRLDISDARLGLADAFAAARRARQGAHLPHPAIRTQSARAVQVDLGRPLAVRLDHELVGHARHLSIRLEPAALTVVV